MNIEFYNKLAPLLLKYDARLITVTKTQSIEAIQKVYDFGLRIYGENRVQELCDKQELLPKDIEWHLIGHLQTNKVKYIAPFIACIHSVDSWKLLEEINKHASANNRIIKCLLQCYIASEETKFGLSKDELVEILQHKNLKDLKNIELVGLMGMATNTEDEKQVKNEFLSLKKLFDEIKATYFESQTSFKEISMGMSSDYELALSCGSTMLRIGSKMF
jgi:pyridoxal phosphate enzyme (YggS family)